MGGRGKAKPSEAVRVQARPCDACSRGRPHMLAHRPMFSATHSAADLSRSADQGRIYQEFGGERLSVRRVHIRADWLVPARPGYVDK